jgi:hypothetical protein
MIDYLPHRYRRNAARSKLAPTGIMVNIEKMGNAKQMWEQPVDARLLAIAVEAQTSNSAPISPTQA